MPPFWEKLSNACSLLRTRSRSSNWIMKGSVSRRGKGSWRIKYEDRRDPRTGERRTRYLTVRGTRADAERELRAALHKVDRGISIEPSSVNLATFLESWLSEVAPLTVGPKALERYHGIVRNQIAPPLGSTSLQRLRPADISGWLLAMIKEGRLSVRTIRHAHGVLRTALNYAASVELVERNVAALVRPPTAPRAKVRILGADEIAETLAALKGHSIYPIVALAMGTGARRGEIAALRWDDIDFSTASARIERSLEQTKDGIRVKVPKTEAGWRTVSLPAIAVDVLREHRRYQQEQRLALGIGAIPSDAPVFGNIDGD